MVLNLKFPFPPRLPLDRRVVGRLPSLSDGLDSGPLKSLYICSQEQRAEHFLLPKATILPPYTPPNRQTTFLLGFDLKADGCFSWVSLAAFAADRSQICSRRVAANPGGLLFAFGGQEPRRRRIGWRCCSTSVAQE